MSPTFVDRRWDDLARLTTILEFFCDTCDSLPAFGRLVNVAGSTNFSFLEVARLRLRIT